MIVLSVVDNLISVTDRRNNTFNVKFRTPMSDIKIGDQLTIRYQGLDNNVPRFPIAVAIRDYE